MPTKLSSWRPARVAIKPAKEHAHYLSADWQARRIAVLRRDAYVCRSCSKVTSGKDAHVDHIRPLEEGGRDDLANLQTLCAACHGRKTADEQRRRGLL
jgi:5-methylcytosine-specific restriction protein A